MRVDRYEHKEFLLQLIAATNFPGQYLDMVYEVRNAIANATIGPDTPDEPTVPEEYQM